jgi:hypothetical protein
MFASNNIDKTISRQATGDTTNLPNIQYCARIQRDSGTTATNNMQMYQSMETTNSIPYAGKTVTVSFYGRKGADYSATSNALNLILVSGTGTDQNVVGGYTGSSTLINASQTLTGTWQRFTATATVGATATELAVGFSAAPTGTAGAADYYEITGVQIDIGSVALPIRRTGSTIQGELDACRRYYWRTLNASNYAQHGDGFYTSATAFVAYVQFPVAMRVVPTSLDYANLSTFDDTDTARTISTIALANQVKSSEGHRLDVTVSGATAARYGILVNNNNTAGYVGFSAEL